MGDGKIEQRCAQDSSGNQSGGPTVKTAGRGVGQQHTAKREQHRGRAHRPLARAEQFQATGHDPVHQRWFLEIVHAVEPRGDPVAARHHLARNLRVAPLVGIGQRITAQPDAVEQRAEQDQPEHIPPVRRGVDRSGRRWRGIRHNLVHTNPEDRTVRRLQDYIGCLYR